MPVLNALPDGRQSDTALFVARGTRRLLRRLNFSTVTELPLLSGRRADIVALASDATILIVEIIPTAGEPDSWGIPKQPQTGLDAGCRWFAERAACRQSR